MLSLSYLGQLQIGFITFDMILRVNNSMKPNFTELAEFIAHELEIEDSQVWLLAPLSVPTMSYSSCPTCAVHQFQPGKVIASLSAITIAILS